MIKTAQGLIPSAHLRDSVAIRVNITSVNDPPVLGRRVALTCDPSLADRKMACPLGPNDPAPLRCDGTGGCTAPDLGQLKTWTQVPPPPEALPRARKRRRALALLRLASLGRGGGPGLPCGGRRESPPVTADPRSTARWSKGGVPRS